MRWDDLQLLRSIDEIEQHGGRVLKGYWLFGELTRPNESLADKEMELFARELYLAGQAGYLTWTDSSSRYTVTFDPVRDSNMWLQTIDDIELTLKGRDRARGRVVLMEPPDPDEDDNRLITGLTMEEIARSIGDTYTAAQLPRYLRESGISEEFVPEAVTGDKLTYVLDILESLHNGGSAARRMLRGFIGGWLSGRYHTPPPEALQRRITSLLAQQGWYVRDGRLVVGERSPLEPDAMSPLGREAYLAALHADIREAIGRFVDEHLDVAIFEAFKLVGNRVKQMTGLDRDGSSLMDAALNISNPKIVFADLGTTTGKDIQRGLYFMFKGAVLGIRNPDAHEQFQPLREEEGLELLAFASMLMRKLDAATVREES